MGARRCGIVMGGASPTFKYDYVAHVSARTRPSPSLLLGYVVQGEGLGTKLGDLSGRGIHKFAWQMVVSLY